LRAFRTSYFGGPVRAAEPYRDEVVHLGEDKRGDRETLARGA